MQKLFLNFDRPVGQPWTVRPFGSNFTTNTSLTCKLGQVITYYEALLPAANAAGGFDIEAISNALYIAARNRNMSLASFAPHDPYKFSIAGAYLAVLMAVAKRQIELNAWYEFGNKLTGNVMLKATDAAGDSNQLANLVLSYNVLVEKINALYVPDLPITQRWLYHMSNIFKDDEGEKSHYMIYMPANYYWLDTSATSPRVGNLRCHFFNLATGTRSVSYWLNIVNLLVSAYTADDDFIQFSTEAIKANLPRLILNPMEVKDGKYLSSKPSIVYDVDEIFSKKNARFVNPINMYFTNGLDVCWDVVEDNYNILRLGKIGSTNEVGLPIFAPIVSASYNIEANANDNYNFTKYILHQTRFPLLSEALIESDAGKEVFLRHVVDYDQVTTQPVMGTLENESGMRGAVGWYHSNSDTDPSIVHGCVNKLIVYGTEILIGFKTTEYSVSSPYNVTTYMPNNIGMNMIEENEMLSLLEHFSGLHAVPDLYGLDVAFSAGDVLNSCSLTLYARDFDYVTSVPLDALSVFKASVAWDLVFINPITAKYDNSSSSKPKGKKGK